MIENRIVVILGKATDWRGHSGAFLASRSVLPPVSDGYVGAYAYAKLIELY